MLRENFIRRFHRNYTITGTGCWDWQACVGAGGYPAVKLLEDGKPIWGGHRVAYHLFKGVIPLGLHVLHTCDNPICVNPAHLILGTHVDNMNDMTTKGRQSRKGRPYTGGHQRPCKSTHKFSDRGGSYNNQAKLNWDAVKEIRRRLDTDNPPMSQLAAQYGVGISTIHRIKHKHSWK